MRISNIMAMWKPALLTSCCQSQRFRGDYTVLNEAHFPLMSNCWEYDDGDVHYKSLWIGWALASSKNYLSRNLTLASWEHLKVGMETPQKHLQIYGPINEIHTPFLNNLIMDNEHKL